MADASADARDRFRPSFPPVEAKLHPPIPRPGTVTRTRLLRLLDAESGPAVVSVVAPPGYGKTVLLAQWAALQERPVAWLTIDDLDNDPAVFLSYVALAMDRVEPIDPSIRGAMATPGPRILATAVPRLASELYRWSRPGLLILDDAHRLVDRICLDALAELLGHLPAGFQVALAARMTPNLPFARYRAHGQLLEIGPSRLALDQRETGELTTRAGHRLTPDEVRTLAERTEGWAAGIYLATLGLERGAGRVQSLDVVSGRDDFIAEYLQAELMRGLDEEDVAFLARTSILETVHPDIAEAVTGLPRGAERLRTLARANRLVSEADAHGTTYRYHHLLREYLQGELERREPALLPQLHRRAWSWYLAAGQVERAVEHAMASGDDDAAARLVTAVALPTFYGGKVGTLDRWLRAFDGGVLERHPPLAVIAGWIHLLAGRAELADAMLDIAEHSTFEEPPADGSASLESSRAMLRAVMGRGGADDILANARLAAHAEAPGSPWLANARWLLGSALLLKGDIAAADAALAQASEAAAASGATAMVAMTKRAGLALARGDLAAAEHHAAASRTILEQADFGEILAALLVHATSARIAIQLGHRTSALEQLALAQMVRPLASRAAPWFSVDALLELARAFLALSDLAGARGALRDATDIARHSRDLGVLNGELADLRQRLGEASSTLAGSSSLTAAELRLLPILSTYLSFQEIAERMHLSRNTVKTQALSIYGKLQASSRSEAVERAVELGLLEPFPGLRLTRRTGAD